jgi:hypothetical protein
MDPRTIKKILSTAMLSMILNSELLFAENKSQSSSAKEFVMGMDAEPNSFLFHWMLLVYEDAFQKLNMPFRLLTVPLARQEKMTEEGLIDAQVGRVYEYGEIHKELVRVEAPFINLEINIYSNNPDLKLNSLNEIISKKLKIEYRRGVMICENALKTIFLGKEINTLIDADQGLSKLLKKRIDLYCDVNHHIEQFIHQGTFTQKQIGNIHPVHQLKKAPMYVYVIKKHQTMATDFAKILLQMEQKGLIEKYKLQAQKEVGWMK